MKTPEEFKEQARLYNITSWPIRKCSICNYQLAYFFSGDSVLFDSGCHCTGGGPTMNERSWEHIANFYNMQKHTEAIKIMNDFWKFEL